MTMKPIRILLVEDDEIDRHGVKRQLQKSQLAFTLIIATSRNEAQELLRAAESYDVVLLDYELGDGTALELLASAGTAPAVIITGNGSEQVAAEAMRRGAYDYLIKDTERNYLELIPLTIESVLSRKRLEKELCRAHAKIRHLHGILPICWTCKKIRDDKGYWDEVENYIRAHTGAIFSHGLCPECFQIEMAKLNTTDGPGGSDPGRAT